MFSSIYISLNKFDMMFGSNLHKRLIKSFSPIQNEFYYLHALWWKFHCDITHVSLKRKWGKKGKMRGMEKKKRGDGFKWVRLKSTKVRSS